MAGTFFQNGLLLYVGAVGLSVLQVTSLAGGVVLRGDTTLMASPSNDESVVTLRKTPFTAIFATVALIGVMADLFMR